MAYELTRLDYSYDALEPFIDTETMHLHHDKHHRAYLDSLNKALARYPRFNNMAIENLLGQLDEVPGDVRGVVRDSGGGHANHELFWKIIGPPKGSVPKGMLAEAITRDLGSFESMQERFTAAATKVFGSGWTYLTLEPVTQKLEILSLPNQDSPLLDGKSVLLCCDLWEHSYYLRYQNRRPDYLKAFWNVVQWDVVNLRIEQFRRDPLRT